MEQFENVLKEATVKGSNDLPGAVLAVVDKNGHYLYKKVVGQNGVGTDAKPMEFDQTFFIASSTKLITSIAALQAVERGQIGLDDPLGKWLPELTSQPLISARGTSEFEFTQATKAITLRHLLTHSSGAVYEDFDPTLTKWRQSRGETPGFSMSGKVAKDYAIPRTFEAGESWMYGLDWAGLLVGRLNNTSLEKYVEEHIAEPLGITSFTWKLAEKPEVKQKLMNMTTRTKEDVLVDGPTPFWPDPEEGAGGAGLFANVHDYTRVLSDLLKETPVLLRHETVDLLFTPQFGPDSGALRGLYANADFTWRFNTGSSIEGVKGNHALGGFINVEDIKRDDFEKPKNTLTWSGLPNLLWNVNREKGIAMFFATQLQPWGDEKVWKLSNAFETAVWRHLVE